MNPKNWEFSFILRLLSTTEIFMAYSKLLKFLKQSVTL